MQGFYAMGFVSPYKNTVSCYLNLCFEVLDYLTTANKQSSRLHTMSVQAYFFCGYYGNCRDFKTAKIQQNALIQYVLILFLFYPASFIPIIDYYKKYLLAKIRFFDKSDAFEA